MTASPPRQIRLVREILKFFQLEWSNWTATPCPVARMRGGHPRSRECKGGSHGDQGQTEARHELDNDSNKDDKCRVQMTSDAETDRHPQEVTSRSTGRWWHASATCHKIDQISSFRRCMHPAVR